MIIETLLVKAAITHLTAAAHGVLAAHAATGGASAVAAHAAALAPEGATLAAKALAVSAAHGPIGALPAGVHAALASVGHVVSAHPGVMSAAETAAHTLEVLGLIAVARRAGLSSAALARAGRHLAAGHPGQALHELADAMSNGLSVGRAVARRSG